MASTGPPGTQLPPDPESAQVEALLARAILLADAGRIPETAPLLDRILQLQPGTPAAVSGLLMTSLYDPSRTPLELVRLHRAWCETLEAHVSPGREPHRDWDPLRPITVGYLSADFREHSCAAFIEPLLRAHDRETHRINLYATLPRRDARTEAFQALADRWVEVGELGDEALAERLRSDGVDLLVDLGGHSAFNRLTVLARRPAPVQLEWLGYPFTTGLTRLEGRITDSLVDPPGSEALASEPLLRLDPCYLCWQPPAQGPEPFEGSRSGSFTFGSFNHFAKLNPAVIQTWAAILRKVPASRLLLKGKGAQDEILREQVLDGFEEGGVRRSRILLADWTQGIAAHLEFYRQVDLALDPFPYNGVTTSIEALWMGVPFVSLRGPHSLSRQGLTLLSQVGLEDLAAEHPATYIAAAVALAGDPARLGRCRQGLRGRLLASPLCDAPQFARRMEALYRELWQTACRKARGDS